jgi:hypothetical protein
MNLQRKIRRKKIKMIMILMLIHKIEILWILILRAREKKQ